MKFPAFMKCSVAMTSILSFMVETTRSEEHYERINTLKVNSKQGSSGCEHRNDVIERHANLKHYFEAGYRLISQKRLDKSVVRKTLS